MSLNLLGSITAESITVSQKVQPMIITHASHQLDIVHSSQTLWIFTGHGKRPTKYLTWLTAIQKLGLTVPDPFFRITSITSNVFENWINSYDVPTYILADIGR